MRFTTALAVLAVIAVLTVQAVVPMQNADEGNPADVTAITPSKEPEFEDTFPPMSQFITPLPPWTNQPMLLLEYEAFDPMDPFSGIISGFGNVSGFWVHDFGMPFMFMVNEHYGMGQLGEPVIGQFLVSPPEDGFYWFCTLAVDLVGNAELLPDFFARDGEWLASDTGGSSRIWDAGTIIDRTKPSSSVTGGVPAVVNSQGPYTLSLNFDDSSPSTTNTSGVSSVDLYAWTPATASWVFTGTTENASGSDLSFNPYSLDGGDGWYHFAAVARDNAGNVEDAPTAISDAEYSVRLNSNSYSFDVVAGWNLVSLPCSTSGDATAVFDDSGGDDATEWTKAMAYGSTGWRIYDKSAPNFVNDLGTVTNSMGIWLWVTSAGDGLLTISGSKPTSTAVSLSKGWNLVGYPSWSDTASVSTVLAGLPYDSVQAFSPTNQYRLRTVADAEAMEPGSGYWVHVTSDCTWTVAG